MKYAWKEVVITPKQPVQQAGFIQQTKPIHEAKDDLHARILFLGDQINLVFISLDSLGPHRWLQEELQQEAVSLFGEKTYVTVSATHTHFAGYAEDPIYRKQLETQLKEALHNLAPEEMGDLFLTYDSIPFEEVGTSRITGHQALVLLNVIGLYTSSKRLATLTVYNCHPTIHNGDTPYFTSEYPGAFIRMMKEQFPEEAFTFMQGSAGDVSTRFTRPSQDYPGMMTLATKLAKKVIALHNQPSQEKQLLSLSYTSTIFPIERSFEPLDLSQTPTNISEAERYNIEVGQTMRKNYAAKIDSLSKDEMISRVGLSKNFKFIFAPNELFSYYMSILDLKTTVLVCYSNGYEPYVTPIDLKVITYEAFMDTWSLATKQRLIDVLLDYTK